MQIFGAKMQGEFQTSLANGTILVLFPKVLRAEIAFHRIDSSVKITSLPKSHDKSSSPYHPKKSTIHARNRLMPYAMYKADSFHIIYFVHYPHSFP